MPDHKTIGHHHPAARASVYRYGGEQDVTLRVRVQDEEIRKIGVDHDGYENVFALVPMEDGSWKRFDLGYGGMSYDRLGPSYDMFYLHLSGPEKVSLEALRQSGVAFGVEVSGAHDEEPTTIWLQGFADNYKLEEF